MSEPTSLPRRPHRYRRPVVAVVTAMVAALVLTPLAPSPVDASIARRSSSPEIASPAADALAVHGEWSESGDPQLFVEFLELRDLTAVQVATDLELDQVELLGAWQGAHPERQIAVLAALSQLGVPYRSNTSAEGEGFDCSGLTTFAWGRAGVQLERQSGTQINAAERLDRDDAQVADLVYYPGHVMMSLGVDTAVVHSPNSGNHVEVRILSESRSASVRYGDPTS